jgi:hypothetical protein
MQGVEKSHCNAAIEAILTAYFAFLHSTVEEALRPIHAYGKSDTLGMDAMPEITIIEALQRYDKFCIVITEETGAQEKMHFANSDDPRRFRTVFLSDPTDRSAQLKKLLEQVPNKNERVINIVRKDISRKKWEEQFGVPAEITGGASAITCIRRGVPIFSVMVNYITQQLFVSCSAGNYVLDLPEDTKGIDLNYVREKGRKIFFRDIDSRGDTHRFVTFMGKQGYKENFMDSRLMTEEEMGKYLHYDLPGGPLRVLYLSNLQPSDATIGFVLANGEKIGEWIHWLPYIRFARKENDEDEPALRLFEIYQDRPWTKEGILMATPPAYSIFKPVSGNDGRMIINVGQFSAFDNPSQIRSTLILAPPDNQWATRVVNQYGYRPIELFSE